MKPLSVFLLLFFSVSVSVSASDSVPSTAFPKAGEESYQRAMIAIQNGSVDEAEEELKKAVLEDPRNPQYHFELANLYAMGHDDSESSGDEYGAAKKMRLAAGELEQAVMASPDFLPAHFNLGIIYKRLGKYEAARREFKEVLRIDPSQSNAMLQIGNTYELQGFFDDAEAIYKEVAERYPENPEGRQALYNLGQSRQQDLMEKRSQAPGLGGMSNLLSGGMGGSPYGNSAYGNPNYHNDTQQQNGAGMQQGAAYLGSMLLQQLFSRGVPTADPRDQE